MQTNENSRLKILLKRNDMSQQDFADWFCVTRDTAWKIINGYRKLEADEIIEICRRFGVTADWLLGISDSEKPYEDAEKYHALRGLIQGL